MTLEHLQRDQNSFVIGIKNHDREIFISAQYAMGHNRGFWKDNAELEGDRDIFLSYYWLISQWGCLEISAKTILAL